VDSLLRQKDALEEPYKPPYRYKHKESDKPPNHYLPVLVPRITVARAVEKPHYPDKKEHHGKTNEHGYREVNKVYYLVYKAFKVHNLDNFYTLDASVKVTPAKLN
jgi:hypothetical protein